MLLDMTDRENPTARHMNKCNHQHLFKNPFAVTQLQSTCKSQLVECKYYISAQVDYDACICCTGKPTIEIPVMIYIPDIIQNMENLRPENWQPKIMPVYTFDLPTSAELGLNAGFSTTVQFSSNYNA